LFVVTKKKRNRGEEAVRAMESFEKKLYGCTKERESI
jgi:hypothetical protein